jgi:hypothetical protein
VHPREAFESWAKVVGLDLEQDELDYFEEQTSVARSAWHAALAWARSTGLIHPPTGTQSLFGEGV